MYVLYGIIKVSLRISSYPAALCASSAFVSLYIK